MGGIHQSLWAFPTHTPRCTGPDHSSYSVWAVYQSHSSHSIKPNSLHTDGDSFPFESYLNSWDAMLLWCRKCQPIAPDILTFWSYCSSMKHYDPTTVYSSFTPKSLPLPLFVILNRWPFVTWHLQKFFKHHALASIVILLTMWSFCCIPTSICVQLLVSCEVCEKTGQIGFGGKYLNWR